MKQHVRIAYRSKGLKAPVYIVSSLTQPEWVPTELNTLVLDDGELEFWREFQVPEGEYQYKFRLGPGDWWALDEKKPSIDDGDGNKNNVIVVEPPRASQHPRQTKLHEATHASQSNVQSSTEGRGKSLDLSDSGLKISNAHPEAINALSKAHIEQPEPHQTYLGPALPMTPPMTPQTNKIDAAHNGKFQPFPTAPVVPDTAIRHSRPSSAASQHSSNSFETTVDTHDPDDVEIIMPKDVPAQQQPGGVLAAMRYFLITIGTWMINMAGGGMRLTGLLAVAVGLAAIVYKAREIRAGFVSSIFSFFVPSWARRSDDSSMV